MTTEFSVKRNLERRAARRASGEKDGTLRSEKAVGEMTWNLDAPRRPDVNDVTKEAPESFLLPPLPFSPDLNDDAQKLPLPNIDVRRLLLGVWSRRFLVLGVTLGLTLLCGFGAYALIDKQWRAVVTLVKREQVDQFSVGDGKAFKPESYNIQTLIDTLKLPSSLDRVIQRTGVDSDRLGLSRMIDVSTGRDSNVLNLNVTWADATTAAQLANEVAEAFVDTSRNIRQEDARETYTYYSAQLEKFKKEVRLLDEKVFKFQRAHSVSNFDEEVKVRLAELSTLETDYQTLRAEVNARRKVEARLKGLINEQPEMIVSYSIYRNPMKQRLTEYEWQLREAKSRYTAKNPKVAKIQKKIDVLKQLIDENADETAPENTYAPNVKRQELELRLSKLTDEIRVSEARMAAIGNTVSRLNEKLSFLTEKEKEYVRLKSRQESAHQLRGRLATWAQEARVLMERNEPSFAIVESATPPPDPLPTRRRMLVAGGGVFSMFLALLIALLLELRDRRIRSAADLTRIADLSFVMEWQERAAPEGLHDTRRSDIDARLLPFRRLLNDLAADLPDGIPQTLAVVSAEPNPRQPSVVAHLGLTFASKELDVLLVEANVPGASPASLAKRFGVHSTDGLEQVLNGGKRLRDVIRKTKISRLHLIASGHVEGRDKDLIQRLGGRRMRSLLSALEQFPGTVLYDLPPLDANETAVEAASAIGACVLVARSGVTDRSELKGLVQILRSRGVEVVGGIVTHVPAQNGAVEQYISRFFEPNISRRYSISEWSTHVQHA
jgi:uncharacterized protein involved in exopolysaccharide biosynthesis/MinD-like ATPase involved in chromosome partitioning or flagellar assembly